MKKQFLCLSLILCFIESVKVTASDKTQSGNTSASILVLQSGARNGGMGHVAAALYDDVNTLFGNPAGYGVKENLEVTFQHQQLIENAKINNLGFILPLKNMSSRNVRDFGAIGGAVSYLDYGMLTGMDAQGVPTFNFSAYEWLVISGYGKSICKNLSAGMHVKLFHLNLLDQDESSVVYDFGFLYFPFQWFSAGLFGSNYGGNIAFNHKKENIPSSIAGGVAFKPFHQKVILAVDVEHSEFEDLRTKTGVEIWTNSVIAVRAGYDTQYEAGNGMTVGIGIKIKEFEAAFFPVKNLIVDYAYIPSNHLGDEHNIALTFRFGD